MMRHAWLDMILAADWCVPCRPQLDAWRGVAPATHYKADGNGPAAARQSLSSAGMPVREADL